MLSKFPSDREEGHPSVERWIAYHGAELPENVMAQLRGHLADCRDCVALLLDLDEFIEPQAEDRLGLSEFEMAAAWRSMRATLPPAAPEAAVVPMANANVVTWTDRRVSILQALAASLLAGVVGLGFWAAERGRLLELRASVENYSQPQTNLSIHDLVPDGATRSGEAVAPVEVGRADFATLIILPSEPFDDYRVEILDAEARPVWSRTGLAPHTEFATLRLGLPPGYLEPGNYRIRLYGGDSKTALEDDFPIRVIP